MTYPGYKPCPLRLRGERRKNEADNEKDREPDQAHAAGSLAERHHAHQHPGRGHRGVRDYRRTEGSAAYAALEGDYQGAALPGASGASKSPSYPL